MIAHWQWPTVHTRTHTGTHTLTICTVNDDEDMWYDVRLSLSLSFRLTVSQSIACWLPFWYYCCFCCCAIFFWIQFRFIPPFWNTLSRCNTLWMPPHSTAQHTNQPVNTDIVPTDTYGWYRQLLLQLLSIDVSYTLTHSHARKYRNGEPMEPKPLPLSLTHTLSPALVEETLYILEKHYEPPTATVMTCCQWVFIFSILSIGGVKQNNSILFWSVKKTGENHGSR